MNQTDLATASGLPDDSASELITTSLSFLEQSRAHLEAAEPYSLFLAAWLARAALETVIKNLLAARGIPLRFTINIDGVERRRRLTTSAQLATLTGVYVDSRPLVFRVRYAWDALSDACHVHAYEFPPTLEEINYLINEVADLESIAENRLKHALK